MSANEEIIIRTILAGTREYLANAQTVVAGNEEMAASTETMGRSMEHTARRSYLMNQALFTMRRLLYANTLAFIAGGVVAVKWGFDFNSAMQQARVALGPLQSSTFDVNQELEQLFNFTKYTPFQFKDITIAFRSMYGAMHPLGITAKEVNFYLKAMADALSFTGRTSPGALNRVAVAFQHLAFMGRLTGQVVLQLARDGLPVYAALKKELGLTADQIHNIGKLGIDSRTAMGAIAKYIETTPGYMNAAHRQATMSLHGLFTTFRDNLSQLMGHVEKNFFNRMQNRLRDMNSWFDRIQTAGKEGDVQNIINAIAGPNAVRLWDRLTDVMNQFWILFKNIVSTVAHSHAFWLAVYGVLTLIDIALHLINPFLQVFGSTLVTLLIPALIYWYTATKIAAFWNGVLALETALAADGIAGLTFTQFLAAVMMGRFALAEKAATAATWLYVTASIALEDALGALRVVAATTAVALDLALGPVGWIALAVTLLIAGLTILYFKWKPFHDLVNSTYSIIIRDKQYIAIALAAAFAPILIAYEAIKHIYQIWNALRGAWGWITGSSAGQSPMQSAANRPALGTNLGGWAPLPPAGHLMPSQVRPMRRSTGGARLSSFNAPDSWTGADGSRVTHVKVQINRKVLADVVAEEISNQGARS